jgi:hypothetical protein
MVLYNIVHPLVSEKFRVVGSFEPGWLPILMRLQEQLPKQLRINEKRF